MSYLAKPHFSYGGKPRVYLAGKIDKYDWRHQLVPNLRGHLWADGPIDAGLYEYVGPFFVSCDHGCNHQPNSHGATAGYEVNESTFTRSNVIRNNTVALDAADMVFAYISAPDCYGTLIELGWALRAGKKVVVVFTTEIPFDDFWYGSHQAQSVHIGQDASNLPPLLNLELHKFKHERLLRRQKFDALLASVEDL